MITDSKLEPGKTYEVILEIPNIAATEGNKGRILGKRGKVVFESVEYGAITEKWGPLLDTRECRLRFHLDSNPIITLGAALALAAGVGLLAVFGYFTVKEFRVLASSTGGVIVAIALLTAGVIAASKGVSIVKGFV